MAPVAVATADHPAAKRRKVREGEARSQSQSKVQADKLSIRRKDALLAAADDDSDDSEDVPSSRRHRQRRGSSSPSPASSRSPRRSRSRSRSRSRQRSRRRQHPHPDSDSELSLSSRAHSHTSSPRHAHSRARPHSQSLSRSPSPSRSHSRSRSRSRLRSDSRSRARARDRSTSSHFSSRSHSRSRSRSRSRSPLTNGDQTHDHGQPATKKRRRRRRRSATPRPHYRRVLAMRGHDGPIAQVRISPDGRWIASASADGTARIWDAATGAHMTTLVGHVAGLSCLAWSPDSNTLATGADDKAIRLWDRVTAEPAHAVGEAVHDDGGAAEGSEDADGRVAVPSAAAMAVRFARRQLREGINGTNGNGTASSGGARGTRLPLLGHHNYVYCLAFSPKGNILASGSYDEAVFLWDVRAGRLMRSLPAHSDPVSGIDFCCDGTLVVSCSTDGLIRIWDTGTGQCLRTLLLLNEDNPAVTNVCFSPNGRFVLAFNLDSCIRLWDYVAQPSIVKKTYQGHLNKRFSIGGCFGRLADRDLTKKKHKPFVAAASEDGDVVLWDVGSKEIVQRLKGAHRDGVVFWVDVCGATMVSCGQDGWINVYRHTEEGDQIEEPEKVDERE